MLRHVILASGLAALANPVQAADHPLEAADAACYDEAMTTVAMVECAAASFDRWDDELNRQYKRLMALLSPDEQQALRDSQRKWIAFRDAEFAFIATTHSRMQGSMYQPLHMEARKELVKARALQLASQVAVLDDTP